MISGRTLISVLIFCCTAVAAPYASEAQRAVRVDSAAVEVRTLDQRSLAKFYSDTDYLYDREPPQALNLWQSIKYWILRRLAEFFSSRAGLTFWRIFPYLFVAGVMAFVIMRLLKADFGNVFYRGALAQSQLAQERIENLHSVDLEALLATALSQQQYRLALRYLFLKTLQQLAARKLIMWKPEKSNHEYLRELQNTAAHEKFRELVDWFEYAWYGDFPISETAFVRAQRAFQEFARTHAV